MRDNSKDLRAVTAVQAYRVVARQVHNRNQVGDAQVSFIPGVPRLLFLPKPEYPRCVVKPQPVVRAHDHTSSYKEFRSVCVCAMAKILLVQRPVYGRCNIGKTMSQLISRKCQPCGELRNVGSEKNLLDIDLLNAYL
jgi:hypothetical protein